MIDVTPNDNLFLCERHAWPVHRPFLDLTKDLNLARRLIHIAESFFLLGTEAGYSGWFREVSPYDGKPDAKGPVFYIQVWHGNVAYRTVGYRNIGYIGILHIQIEEGKIEDEMNRDYIGDACKGVDANVRLPEGYAEECVAYVDDGMVEIAFPHGGT